jgi:hypothetical protein
MVGRKGKFMIAFASSYFDRPHTRFIIIDAYAGDKMYPMVTWLYRLKSFCPLQIRTTSCLTPNDKAKKLTRWVSPLRYG